MKKAWHNNLLRLSILIPCIIFSLLPSCTSKVSKKRLQNPREIKNSSGVFDYKDPFSESESAFSARICSRIIREQEAKMVDIPFPLGAVPLENVSVYTQDESVIGYQCSASNEDLREFYTLEMEREGWCNLMSIASSESMLVFSKPYRLCVISLRESEQSQECRVFIFVGKKNTCV